MLPRRALSEGRGQGGEPAWLTQVGQAGYGAVWVI